MLGETLYSRGYKFVTSVSIDPSVAAAVKEMCDRSGVPLSRLVNTLLEAVIVAVRAGKAEELINAIERVTGRNLKVLRAVVQ